jgi:hypothetical protein
MKTGLATGIQWVLNNRIRFCPQAKAESVSHNGRRVQFPPVKPEARGRDPEGAAGNDRDGLIRKVARQLYSLALCAVQSCNGSSSFMGSHGGRGVFARYAGYASAGGMKQWKE